MEPEICTKMFRNLSAKLAAKFQATTHSFSMVEIAPLKDSFSEMFLNWKQAQIKHVANVFLSRLELIDQFRYIKIQLKQCTSA